MTWKKGLNGRATGDSHAEERHVQMSWGWQQLPLSAWISTRSLECHGAQLKGSLQFMQGLNFMQFSWAKPNPSPDT